MASEDDDIICPHCGVDGFGAKMQRAFAEDNARLREALAHFETWADGFANRRQGMGSGMHAATFPSLTPDAAREMLRVARDALAYFRGLAEREGSG